MRIEEYKSRNGCLDGQVSIRFSESEIGIIDNALFEASRISICKKVEASAELKIQQIPALSRP